MVQTLQIMVGAIEARKAVVAEREAARLAETAAPAVQSKLSAYLPAATNVNDAAPKAAREKARRKAKSEARQQLDKERQATAMEDLQLLYETLANLGKQF